MARMVDAAKRRQWLERLRRFERGKHTVAAFCAVERVSVPSFYQWRKKLSGGSGLQSSMKETVAPSLLQAPTQSFVPLQFTRAAMFEIHLPNGARVVLPATDVAVLESTIAMVARLHPVNDGEVESC